RVGESFRRNDRELAPSMLRSGADQVDTIVAHPITGDNMGSTMLVRIIGSEADSFNGWSWSAAQIRKMKIPADLMLDSRRHGADCSLDSIDVHFSKLDIAVALGQQIEPASSLP